MFDKKNLLNTIIQQKFDDYFWNVSKQILNI